MLVATFVCVARAMSKAPLKTALLIPSFAAMLR